VFTVPEAADSAEDTVLLDTRWLRQFLPTEGTALAAADSAEDKLFRFQFQFLLTATVRVVSTRWLRQSLPTVEEVIKKKTNSFYLFSF